MQPNKYVTRETVQQRWTMENKEEGLCTLIYVNLNKNHRRGGFTDQKSGYSSGAV